jgi:hypothetical protein
MGARYCSRSSLAERVGPWQTGTAMVLSGREMESSTRYPDDGFQMRELWLCRALRAACLTQSHSLGDHTMIVRVHATELIVPGLACFAAGLFVGMAFDAAGSGYELLLTLLAAAAFLVTAVFLVRDANSEASPAA